MKIEPLANHLDLVPLVARWHHDEWGRDDSRQSFQHWIDRIGQRANRDRIPITYLAFIEDTPAGTAMIVENDMTTHPELTPWLGGVYVIPERRRQGVASALVRYTLDQAGTLDIQRLYLYTNGAEPVYEKFGWKTWSREVYKGRVVTIMSISL